MLGIACARNGGGGLRLAKQTSAMPKVTKILAKFLERHNYGCVIDQH